MAGDKNYERAIFAMSQRNTGKRRHCNRRGHTGHNLEVDSSGRQRFRLLAAAAEDKWVTTLEPHDSFSSTSMFDQNLIDRGLLKLLGPIAHFAGIYSLGCCRGHLHDLGAG